MNNPNSSKKNVGVRDWKGRLVPVVVLEVRDGIALVCTPAELEAAAAEDREPNALGFKLDLLVEDGGA